MLANPSRLWLSAFLLGAILAGGLLLAESHAGYGCGCRASAPFPNPVRAEADLAAADPQGRNAAAQRRAALAVLGARPVDISAWLRLAYADSLDHGGKLVPDGISALDRSYRLAAYASGLAPWRAGFALDNWAALPPATRQAAAREFTLAVGDPPRFHRLRRIARALPRGEGKVAAYLFGLL